MQYPARSTQHATLRNITQHHATPRNTQHTIQHLVAILISPLNLCNPAPLFDVLLSSLIRSVFFLLSSFLSLLTYWYDIIAWRLPQCFWRDYIWIQDMAFWLLETYNRSETFLISYSSHSSPILSVSHHPIPPSPIPHPPSPIPRPPSPISHPPSPIPLIEFSFDESNIYWMWSK